VTGINSDLSGQVIATVTSRSMTRKRTLLLIPRGPFDRRYDSQVAFGQRECFSYAALILSGQSRSHSHKLPGIDQAGYAVSRMVSTAWAAPGRSCARHDARRQLGAGSFRSGQYDGNVVIALRNSAQDTTNQVGQEITRRNLRFSLRSTVRPGFPMDVMGEQDLVLRPYQPLFSKMGSPVSAATRRLRLVRCQRQKPSRSPLRAPWC